MIAFLQRVTEASVDVDGQTVGKIGAGLMVLLCAERGDLEADAELLLGRLLGYRVFGDEDGKMNMSLSKLADDAPGEAYGLLLVPQFTLAADTRSGTRPSFTPAAPPEIGRRLFQHFVDRAKVVCQGRIRVETGVFGAHMRVGLVNDGPVSFWLETRKNANS